MNSNPEAEQDGPHRKPRKRRRLRGLCVIMLVFGIAVAGYFLWHYHGPAEPVEIYQGITYGCERLPATDESGGLMHWARADLKVPGVSLFVTPTDAEARLVGYEYKLKYTTTEVAEQHLAVGVNGTLFSSDSWWIRLPGDNANAIETAVADHVVNHIHPHSYMLWWDDALLAHLELNKPPRQEDVSLAKWGISGQQPIIIDGQVSMFAGLGPDARTIVAADPVNRLVWIACFDKASFRAAAQQMVAKGAKIGVMLDGGTSVAMAIGEQAKNVRPGVITGNWRPVATHFGFRATPLP